MEKKKAVILTPEIPKTEPTSAGERLIRELYFALEAHDYEPVFVAPAPRNGYATEYDVRRYFVDVAEEGLQHGVAKIRTGVSTWTPNLEFCLALRQDKGAQKLLREAELIDLQWSASILLAPWIRSLNKSARIVGTYHDISEQRLKRRSSVEGHPLKSLAWKSQALVSRYADTLANRFLDRIVVLSEKDRSLLPVASKDHDKVLAVSPPVYFDAALPLAWEPAENNLLFVGTMYRWENHQAAQWFIQEILPLIWAKRPDVTFTVVGESPSSDLLDIGKDPRITFTGFVESVEPYYASAAAVVAPLQLGSGVKFKTLDAILRGIPVVATGVGVEGIAKVDWVSGMAHTPAGFAEQVLKVLDSPELYHLKAKESQAEALSFYSQESYREQIGLAYA